MYFTGTVIYTEKMVLYKGLGTNSGLPWYTSFLNCWSLCGKNGVRQCIHQHLPCQHPMIAALQGK